MNEEWLEFLREHHPEYFTAAEKSQNHIFNWRHKAGWNEAIDEAVRKIDKMFDGYHSPNGQAENELMEIQTLIAGAVNDLGDYQMAQAILADRKSENA